jgi:lipooligosaccharide transport system permease protein
MSDVFENWQGATKLVDVRKSNRWGAVYVALARGRESFKWLTPMIAYGVGHPVLYLMSIGIGLGTLVSKNMGLVDGVSYLSYLAPALLLAAALSAAVDETSFCVLQGFSWERGFYSITQTAINSHQVASGVMLYALFRVTWNSLVYGIILVLFGALSWAAVPGQVLLAIVLGMSWGFAMLAYSSFIKEEGDWLVLIMRFVVAPMFMFSGTFYQLENMPQLVQNIAWVSPLWHAIELGRNWAYGSPDSYAIWHWVFLIGLGAVGAAFAYPQFKRRLAR